MRRERPDLLVAQEVDQRWVNELDVLKGEYPFAERAASGGGAGIALYSRLPLEHSEVIHLRSDLRPAIAARVNVGGAVVSLLTVHPRAPLRPKHFELRNELLLAGADFTRTLPAPKILIGDLNTSPWSPYYSDLIRRAELMDARKGFGLRPSWPTFMPLGAVSMIPIDHCLVSPDIQVSGVRTGDGIGSDHLPLIVEVEVPGREAR